jgi:hypothetical protein
MVDGPVITGDHRWHNGYIMGGIIRYSTGVLYDRDRLHGDQHDHSGCIITGYGSGDGMCGSYDHLNRYDSGRELEQQCYISSDGIYERLNYWRSNGRVRRPCYDDLYASYGMCLIADDTG